MTVPAFGEAYPCRTCLGKGKVRLPAPPGDKHLTRRVTCPECGGAGFVPPAVADRENIARREVIR